MNLKSMGISYNSKNWTIPESFPTSFIINGTTYTVTVPTTTMNSMAVADNTEDLESRIAELEAENASLKEQLASYDSNDDIDEIKFRLQQQEDINTWYSDSLNAMGIYYSNNTWFFPTELPESITSNGRTIKVVKEAE